MDMYSKIRRQIQHIAKDGKQRVFIYPARVEVVKGSTCSVRIDELPVTDVRLRAVINTNTEQVLVTPKVGSYVLVVDLSAGDYRDLAVIACSEVSEVNIKIGNTTATINAEGVMFNGGANGGMTITPKLVEQLDKMSARIDGIIDAINNGVPVAQDGGVALQTSIKAYLAGIVDKENFDNVENEKIKQ